MLRSWAIIIEIFELFLIVWLEDLEITSVYCVRLGDVRNFLRVISGVLREEGRRNLRFLGL